MLFRSYGNTVKEEDTWQFIVNDGEGVKEPQAVDPKAGVDNPPPLYNNALAKSHEQLNTEEQLLFVKTCNNYRYNCKRGGLIKYIKKMQDYINRVTGRKQRGAEYKNGYKWIIA